MEELTKSLNTKIIIWIVVIMSMAYSSFAAAVGIPFLHPNFVKFIVIFGFVVAGIISVDGKPTIKNLFNPFELGVDLFIIKGIPFLFISVLIALGELGLCATAYYIIWV